MTNDERGRAVVEALPTYIRVGPHDIAIEKWPDREAHGRSRWGEFSVVEQKIRVQLSMPSASKAVEIFLHELTHAIYSELGIDDEDKEERTVTLVATGLTCVFRDNPWLGSWIDDALNPEQPDDDPVPLFPSEMGRYGEA